jgi:succinyl-diaminopimelate desuccinylase
MTSAEDRAVELAQALIRCPSVTPREGGALDVLIEALAPAGFVCERLVFGGGDAEAVDNLYARAGAGSPHLCFAGHTDVVPPGDLSRWTHPPFAGEIAGDVLYGRGAADMKGAVACFAAAALDYLAAQGDDFDGSISLLITGDEEGVAVNGTCKVLEWMAPRGERPDHCLVGEPTNGSRLGEAIKIGRRGSLSGMLTVTGIQGHVAYPHLALNPVRGLIAVLAQLYDKPLDFGSAHFSASNFEVTSIDVGNPATNVIPAVASARFNIRFNDRHTAEALETLLKEQTAEALAKTGLSFELVFEPANHAFLTEPGPLDALLSEAVRDVTGLTPALTTDGGTSDARFIKDLCPVVEFGLTTATIHKVDEQVPLSDLAQLTAIYRRFLELYFEAFGAGNAG